jgi:hypothetical protein
MDMGRGRNRDGQKERKVKGGDYKIRGNDRGTCAGEKKWKRRG